MITDSEDRLLGHSQLHINQLKSVMEKIAGDWNGDLPGVAEDRAHVANDIINCCDKLSELLTEFGEI